MIDLHAHSTASDGTLSPQELVHHALEIGLAALALTDHDTIDGIAAAREACLGTNLCLIPGVELEIASPVAGVFHLLGLGIDPESKALGTLLEQARTSRHQRNLAILEKMRADGIDASLEDIIPFAGGTVISRPHFADFLVDRRLSKNRADAFERFLASGRSYHVPYAGLELPVAIDAIHAAGGRAFLAHPQSIFVSMAQLPQWLAQWREAGLDGVEIWHPGLSWNDARRLEAMATPLGMRCSAGSDFHGERRPDRILGKSLADRRKIDDAFLACLD